MIHALPTTVLMLLWEVQVPASPGNVGPDAITAPRSNAARAFRELTARQEPPKLQPAPRSPRLRRRGPGHHRRGTPVRRPACPERRAAR
jgi:hypothetical protein